MTAREVADGYFAAVSARDLDAMARFWDDEIVGDLVPIGIFRGPAALGGFFEELFTAVPDLDFAVKRTLVDGDVATVEWRLSGSFSGGPFQGIEPTDRRIELRGVDCVETAAGRIVHNTAYYDGAAFARAIGMLPPQDSGAERAITAGFNALVKLRRTLKEIPR
jgi:ketosteroid isomerase-like protein